MRCGRWLLVVGLLAVLPKASPAQDAAGGITPAGERLAEVLDGMDVEHRWLAGDKIDWRTGQKLGPAVGPGAHTHCSAFVAAACERLKVPMLLPPPQQLLANRQNDWLHAEGKDRGWRQVDALEAQRLANAGHVAVASWRNRETDGYHNGSGHIAIVRPYALSVERITRDGPQIIQAGGHNFSSTTVAYGFRTRAWDQRQVEYFAYTPAVSH